MTKILHDRSNGALSRAAQRLPNEAKTRNKNGELLAHVVAVPRIPSDGMIKAGREAYETWSHEYKNKNQEWRSPYAAIYVAMVKHYALEPYIDQPDMRPVSKKYVNETSKPVTGLPDVLL